MEKERKQTVETNEKEIIFTRVFKAPRELVFETYTSCKHLMNWWGPREWPLKYCKMDFREGGSWHYCMKGPNPNDESWGLAIFKKIIEPEMISYNDHFSDKDGNVNSEMPSLVINVKFKSLNGNTEMKTITKVGSKEEIDKLIDMGMIEGFTETWDRLEEHLAAIQPD